jgi:release factor glutamine methyltransferase
LTFREALKSATARLTDAGVPDAPRDARWLLAAAANVPRDRLSVLAGDALDPGAQARLDTMLCRRVRRVPVSQIIGEKSFYGRDFHVDSDVLTPRPETESLVALALSEPFERVLDMGTGSGAILVTLLAERPQARGVGTDISAKAAVIAGRNAARHGVADRITLPLSDWWRDVGSIFDLIVSNPPYIAADEMDALMPEVRDHEPREALTDEGDGLSAYRLISAGALDHLTPGGRLIVEIGPSQGQAIHDIFEAAGLAEVQVHPDLDGRDRVVFGRKPA